MKIPDITLKKGKQATFYICKGVQYIVYLRERAVETVAVTPLFFDPDASTAYKIPARSNTPTHTTTGINHFL